MTCFTHSSIRHARGPQAPARRKETGAALLLLAPVTARGGAEGPRQPVAHSQGCPHNNRDFTTGPLRPQPPPDIGLISATDKTPK